MYYYLGQHPQVFLPPHKELNYFADDLFPGYIGEREYLDHFSDAGDASAIGEASVWYLFSRSAAHNIHEFDPDARIVIMLRDPAEMLYSLHSEHYFHGMEQEEDFAVALARNPAPKPLLDYKGVARYVEQVSRYLELFGSSQVHIILYQDIKRDLSGVYRRLLRFLDLDVDFKPDFKVHNANKVPRSILLRRISHLPEVVLQPLRTVLPFRLRRSLIKAITRWNSMYKKRPGLAEELVQSMRMEFAGDVQKLIGVTGLDLGEWLPGKVDVEELDNEDSQ
jgi:hypothetical protein